MTISGFESPIAAPIKQNEIKMLFCSKAFRARCFKGQGNARGNTLAERTVLAGKDKLTSTTLLSDQRGAVALEMPIVWLFLMMSLLLPLADLAIAGFRFISAHQALRDMGQRTQYSTPDATDPNSITAWKSSLPDDGRWLSDQCEGLLRRSRDRGPLRGRNLAEVLHLFNKLYLVTNGARYQCCAAACTVNYSQRFQ